MTSCAALYANAAKMIVATTAMNGIRQLSSFVPSQSNPTNIDNNSQAQSVT